MDWATVVNGVVVAVIPVLVEGFRRVLPGIPRVVVWTLPMVFGGVLVSIGNFLAAFPAGMSTWEGIALGAAAMVLRELVSTVKDHGIGR